MTRIAITGADGFVGSHLAGRLRAAGDEVVPLSRRTGFDLARPDIAALTKALDGCGAVVHTAGINREIGRQTFDAVHIRGTQALVAAAAAAGVGHISMVSFLRARPDGPTAYHRSKWAAEAIVRDSGLAHTILKCGVIYGRGDNIHHHLSHGLYTFPIFGLVGLPERPLRPVAVDDVARILEAAAHGDAGWSINDRGRRNRTLYCRCSILPSARRRRHRAFSRYVRLPVAAHVVLARVFELTMKVPLLAVAQVHILAEGAAEPLPDAPPPPDDLVPQTRFDEESIRAGLPPAGQFGLRDLRLWPG